MKKVIKVHFEIDERGEKLTDLMSSFFGGRAKECLPYHYAAPVRCVVCSNTLTVSV